MGRFRFNWVLVGELAVGTIPYSKESMDIIKSNKITSIISLCSESEGRIYQEIKKHFSCHVYVLPDHKVGKTPTKIQVEEILELIKKIKKNGPIFIHCQAAVERSPLICMAWLIKDLKLKPTEAMEYLSRVNSSSNILPEAFNILQEIK